VENDRQPSSATLTITDRLATWVEPAARGHFNELSGLPEANNAKGLAPAWSSFFEQVGHEGLNELNQRMRDLNRQVRDNGITYNVYADPHHPQRPWSLDLFPLLLDHRDWLSLAQGVQQRVQLLEKIMADVYGAQRLLHEALIPPALVQGHPGYLRSLHGVTPVGETRLHIVAFDMARSPQGHWWVVSQRTQAPSGLGYLLENRLIISRLFPQAFEAMQVQRLAATYRALMEGIRQRSPAGADAHIALLTPGPYNETYFEHAYLARYLGITLVEGSDLTVRDQRLYLNTLRGLEPVHGLIKRLDDQFLDPLELRADSTLGVPGLLQAIRAGHVLVANAPGSAFLESPALLGFLPALSEALLGEPLQLPSLPTWWCGERAAREEAQHRLGSSVIKPTFPWGLPGASSQESVLGRALSQRAQDEWTGRIARQGDDYTVQSYLPFSQMPTWQTSQEGGGIKPRSVLLRVFAVSQAPGQWNVLPGGLARLATPGVEIASMQRGGSSADVWVPSPVCAHGAEESETTSASVHVPASASEAVRKRLVTSRAAENLYWLGRYSERSENALSLARLTLEALSGENQHDRALLQWLHDLTTRQGLVPPGVPHPQVSRRLFERTLIATLNQDEWTSVGYNLRALRQAASAVRERLSLEHWNLIDRTEKDFFTRCAPLTQQGESASLEALQLLDTINRQLAAITGAQTDRMVRDDGWRLLSIGRHVERLGFLAAALNLAFESGGLDQPLKEDAVFTGLLSLFDSTITFQSQYQQNRSLSALLALLVQDTDNPRSLAWVAQTLRGRLSKLAGSGAEEWDGLARSVPTPSDWKLASSPPREPLQAALQSCVQSVLNLSDAISARYFTHLRDGEQSLGF
jgi:uncharacterized circularly permuted ATP-grasp superfamily protein/uncharacterized alpha-E superfamily protein